MRKQDEHRSPDEAEQIRLSRLSFSVRRSIFFPFEKTYISAYRNTADTAQAQSATDNGAPHTNADNTVPMTAKGTWRFTVHINAIPSGYVANIISAQPNKYEQAQ